MGRTRHDHHQHNDSPRNPNQALWEKGDFTRIAATMRSSGEDLVRRIGVTPGLAGARPRLRRRHDRHPGRPGRRQRARRRHRRQPRRRRPGPRAEQLGLTNCTFEQGDASNLTGLDDDSFDLVVTVFGAMFAPRPFDTAAEMVRVTKPGGRIVMGNWIPGDPDARRPDPADQRVVLAAATRRLHQPRHVGRRRAHPRALQRRRRQQRPHHCERDTWVFDFAGTPKELVGVFRDYYGPTMNAFAAAESNGRAAELQAELDDVVRVAEHEHGTGPHRDPGHLHACHRDTLTEVTCDVG